MYYKKFRHNFGVLETKSIGIFVIFKDRILPDIGGAHLKTQQLAAEAGNSL